MILIRKSFIRIVLALLLPFVTCEVQWLFWSTIKPFVWFLFFPTVFFSSRIGGKNAGLVSTAISALLVVYFFIPPQLSFLGKNPSHLWSVLVFLLMGVLFSVTHDRLERANRRAAEALEESRIANEQLQKARIGRLQAEQEQTEAMYRSLFDNMLNGFAYCRMIFDGETPLDFIYLNVNEAFEKQTGLRNVVGKRVTEVIPGIRESDPEVFDRYGRVALTGNPERFEIYVEALKSWYSISVYSPTRKHFVVIFDVITERKEAEIALRTTDERLKLALAASRMGVWEWDLQSNAVYWSPECYDIVGLKEFNGTFEAFAEMLHPDDKAHVMEWVNSALSQRNTYKDEFRIIRSDGEQCWLSNLGRGTYDSNRVPLRLTGTVQDITERKRLEEQFRQSQKMEAVGQLAGGIAHDFNNMLNVILGYAEMALLRLTPDDPLNHNLQEILKAGNRSAALTRQLLAFARKQDSVPAIINLNEVITDQIKMLERLIGEDVTIEFNPSAELWNTRIDPSQIDQILTNLAVNARDAIAGTGTVVIETANVVLAEAGVRFHADEPPGEYVLLVFSDTGFGMDEATRERIFEPFFTTKEQGKGTGLGLSTVYGIIKQNGGLINVYSEPATGTTFRVYLPRFAGEGVIQHEERQTVSMAGTETVLLVEDDEQILNVVRTMLELNGYQVLPATSAEEGCRLCAQYDDRIDLLITDVIMPQLNGKELQARIEKLKPGIRTLFMSGYIADIIANRGVIAEGVNFISKPFSLHSLARKVRDVLDG